jgi:hypothetical protein
MRGRWTVEEIEPMPGVPLLAHLESLLPPSGRGPVPNGGDPLPDEPPKDPSVVRWGGGSFDGILALRGGRARGDEPLVAASSVLHLVRTDPSAETVHATAERLGALTSPQQIDRLLRAVLADRSLDRERLAAFARWLCVHGTRRELVKTGIALLGASGTPNDRELIARLGLLEELTLYAVVALANVLDDSEGAIFDLAQQVNGWGRIHAVYRLAGSTNPDVCRWLLRGGAENAIMTEEIAFIAATTGGLREALEGDVDADLLDHAGELLRALAVGGPAEDMSDYSDGGAAMRAFARHIRHQPPTLDRIERLRTLEQYVRGWARDNPHLSEQERDDLALQFTALLDRPDCEALVRQTLASDDIRAVRRAVAIASRFDIDARPTVLDWLHREPHDSYLWHWFAERTDGDRLPELLDLAETLLDFETLASGPSNDVGLGLEYEPDQCLQSVIVRLCDFPPQGWRAVRTGLNNRVIATRNVALRVLKAWPRDQWPADVEQVLTALLWREPDDGVRRSIRELLDAR